MILSSIDYHLVMLTRVAEHFEPRMKSDLAAIMPDVMAQFFGGTIKSVNIRPDRIYLHFSAPPEHSPKDIADTLARQCTIRLARVYKKLEGFSSIFRDDFYLKSGAKPKRKQIEDFICIVKTGI